MSTNEHEKESMSSKGEMKIEPFIQIKPYAEVQLSFDAVAPDDALHIPRIRRPFRWL
jgi:hypothetical protein